MTDSRSKSTIFLEERLRPAFEPSAEARKRMRDAVLARAAGSSTTPSALVGRKSDDASTAGIRRALQSPTVKLSAGVFVVLGIGALVLGYDAHLASRAVSTERRMSKPVLRLETCREPYCAPTRRHDVVDAPAAPSMQAPDTLASPHRLPDAPRNPSGTTAPGESVVRAPTPARASSASSASGANEPSKSADRPAPMVERAADSLGEEARLIREAQIGLRAGDVAGARKSLDAHAQTFPRGVLRDERLVLEVLVLCAEGRVESARRAADELLRTHPLSSHSESLRASCAGTSMP